MDLDTEWQRLPFPLHPEIVYVVKIGREGKFIPLYVGMSETRNVGRIGDYVSCQFTGKRDFIVGTAVRHLVAKGFEVVVDYRLSSNPRGEEKKLIADLSTHFVLLNGRLTYEPEMTTEDLERERIRRFIDQHFH